MFCPFCMGCGGAAEAACIGAAIAGRPNEAKATGGRQTTGRAQRQESEDGASEAAGADRQECAEWMTGENSRAETANKQRRSYFQRKEICRNVSDAMGSGFY